MTMKHIYHKIDYSTAVVTLSLDWKALDRLEWAFLFAVYEQTKEKKNFGPV